MWSAVGALPLWGSLIGKGGRKAVSLAGDLAEASQTMKLASEGSQAIRKLSLVLEVPAGLVLDFDKAMSHFADQLRAAMMAPEYNRLYMAGIEYVNDVEIFYRMTDGAVDGMQSAWRLESNLIEEAADVWKVPEEAADARKLAGEVPDAGKVAGESGRVADDVVEGGTGVRGKLTGSLDGLKPDERTVISEWLDTGYDVEIIPRSNSQGVKTPDFYVNGVKTELKTLNGTSLNTPLTRIQEGFGQGAETVIIDARKTGMTLEEAEQVIKRALGIYKGSLPGTVEMWTKEGTIRR